MIVAIYLVESLVLGNSIVVVKRFEESIFFPVLEYLDKNPGVVDKLETVYFSGQNSSFSCSEIDKETRFFSVLIKNRVNKQLGTEGMNLLKQCLSWSGGDRLCSQISGRISGFYNVLDHPFFDCFVDKRNVFSMYTPFEVYNSMDKTQNKTYHDPKNVTFYYSKLCGFSVTELISGV
jgi:hypothetical protein